MDDIVARQAGESCLHTNLHIHYLLICVIQMIASLFFSPNLALLLLAVCNMSLQLEFSGLEAVCVLVWECHSTRGSPSSAAGAVMQTDSPLSRLCVRVCAFTCESVAGHRTWLVADLGGQVSSHPRAGTHSPV